MNAVPRPPSFGLLSDRQQRGLDCAHCGRPVCGPGRLVGIVHRARRKYGVYACEPACPSPATTPATTGATGWRAGFCWWCRRDGLPVTWVGPAVHGASHAPVHACAECCHWLADRVGEHQRR